MLKLLNIIFVTIAAGTTLGTQLNAQATTEQPDRADPVEEIYNLVDVNLGLKGYDPVQYFTSGEAMEGSEEIEIVYGGVAYRFTSQENMEMFLENPTKYEPTYGGWCAWAMANQAYADINPTLFTLQGNRLHFFISRGAKARFDQRLEANEAAADAYWLMESGEAPRL